MGLLCLTPTNSLIVFIFNKFLGLGLNSSEKIMTILFSVALGVAALGLVVYVFHRCKQRIQYLHQPLDNTEDTGKEFNSSFIIQSIQTHVFIISV